MQNFSAQDITYANYKEKLDMVLKNCKQNEIILKNQQRRSISRSNSREKSLNVKSKQPAPLQKQPVINQSNSGSTQQQGSKKNLTRNRNLSITTSYEKKQNSSHQSNSKQIGQGNSTCTNNKTAQNYVQSGTQSVQNKSLSKKLNNPQSCKNQNNSVSNNNNINNNVNQIPSHQQSNNLTPGMGGEQYHNFSSFFSSQSTKNNINNNLLNNSIQGVQQVQKNSDKITLFLQHLQGNDSPMKQIQQIQDKLQSYHHNNNQINAQQYGNAIQQQLNSSINNQTLNLNNSYSNNNPQLSLQQLQQSLHQRQRVNSNDCVFNINQSSITAAGMQSDQYDPYKASYSHQDSLHQFQSNDQNISIQHQNQKQPVAQVNLKLNVQSKNLKNNSQSPVYNPYTQKKNAFSMHSSASSNDPNKCLLNQFEDQFTPSSSIAPQNKFIDLSGANIQISSIALDKKMNINELNDITSQQHSQFLKQKTQQLIESQYHHQQNNSENYDDLSNNEDNEILAASMPVDCNVGQCIQDDEYLHTPKQNIYSEITKSQQLPYQHTPITYNQPKQSLGVQGEKIRSKSFADQEYQSEMVISIEQQQNKIFQKRRALTIADDSYVVLKNEDEQDSKIFGDSIKVNHTYNGEGGEQHYQKAKRKLVIPKIQNFDQMIEEKNQQMDYEIPPHVYNETFQGEEYSSSHATSEMRSETHDSLNQTQNLENNVNQDSINLHPSLKSNPMQGYRNIMKAMEISGKDNDAEIKALKVTIRKLQYRDAVLRQKIAKMTTTHQEQQETIQKLDAENNELINQVNAYSEQHELYESQVNQLQYELQQFQVQVEQLQISQNNNQIDNEVRIQIAQYEEAMENLRQQLVQSEQTTEELREKLQDQEDIQQDLQQQLSQRDEEIQKQQYGFLEKLAEFQEENIRINQILKTQSEQVLKNDEKQQLTKQINDLNSENEKLYEQIASLLKENEQYKQQKEVVSNVNDLSLKSLKLLDDNSKLMDENRTLQANILILNKDNKQLKDGILSLQQQIQQIQDPQDKQSPSNTKLDETKYIQKIEESQCIIQELKLVNQQLLQNIQNLENKNKELCSHCSALESRVNYQIESMKQLSSKQSREDTPLEKSLQEKEVVTEKEKCETLEKKIIQMSQKNSLNQSIQSKQEYQSEEMMRMKLENDDLKKELEEQCKEKECLEEVLKNYLLQRELEKLKLSGDQKILNEQEQDDEIAQVFQSDSKLNAFLNSQQKTNTDLNSQLLNYFSNSNQNKQTQLSNHLNNLNQGENYHMYKRNSNCTMTGGNNTNYQISITECSQLSLLDEDGRVRMNDDEEEEVEADEEFRSNFHRNNINNNNIGDNQNQDPQNTSSNLHHLTSSNTNINNNNFNNNNNTIHSNNILKKSSASSSHFLREIDSNIQILINNNSNNTLLNNIQQLLNTSSSSNLLSRENTTNNNNNNNITKIPNPPNQEQQQTTSIPSTSNLLQNLQLTPIPSNNQHQQNLSHQNLSTKLVTYHHSQKTKENDNHFNMSQPLLISSVQVQNPLQQMQQQKGFSEKLQYQQQCASQVKSTNQYLKNKENEYQKTQLNQFTPHSIAPNTNK